MTVKCFNCGESSPDGSQHCVHCGAGLTSDEARATQFGMPLLRPSNPSQPSADELEMAQMGAARGASDPAAPYQRSPLAGLPRPSVSSTPSPLAGLPRPSVASAPSPLTREPSTIPAAPRGQVPSARNTVMGMPLFTAAQQVEFLKQDAKPVVTPAAQAAPVMNASIQSLNDFGQSLGDDAKQSPSAPAEPTPTAPAQPRVRAAVEVPMPTAEALALDPTAPQAVAPRVSPPKPMPALASARTPISELPRDEEDGGLALKLTGAIVGIALIAFAYWFFTSR